MKSYESRAQERKFHRDPKLKKHAPAMDSASRGLMLPERVKPKPTAKHKRRVEKRRTTALGAMLAHTQSVHR